MFFKNLVNSEWCVVDGLNNHSLLTIHHSPSQGYSLLELMLAMAVGSIILAGTYTANVIVAKQYERISSFVQVQEMAIPSLRIIARDVRMAGYVALDATVSSTYGTITTPISITDSGNACCDSIAIIYDTTTTNRIRITYSVSQRTAAIVSPVAIPAKNALYRQVETWNSGSSTWSVTTANSLVADYIEDLQFVGSDLDTNSNPRIVDMFMLFRSKSLLPANVTYTKPVQTVGDFNYNITDMYHRDEFSATINIKNLR